MLNGNAVMSDVNRRKQLLSPHATSELARHLIPILEIDFDVIGKEILKRNW